MEEQEAHIEVDLGMVNPSQKIPTKDGVQKQGSQTNIMEEQDKGMTKMDSLKERIKEMGSSLIR